MRCKARVAINYEHITHPCNELLFKVSQMPENHLSFARGESLSYWFRGNLCDRVCFDLPVERIFFVCINRFELRRQSKQL